MNGPLRSAGKAAMLQSCILKPAAHLIRSRDLPNQELNVADVVLGSIEL